MHIKKQEIKKKTVLLDGRLVIQPMMEDKEISPTFESMWAKIPPKAETDDEYHPREEVNIIISGEFIVETGDESQLIEYAALYPDEYDRIRDDVVILYPTPTVWSAHVMKVINEQLE